ncbi:unnamed protein product [[Candida] boidinii]|uniref:Unnamed protein product n=1 Tax=Candida boidinii TaxID=5477 RepID=A0A9W6SVB6_CANBO|nr:hypothetical protein B5S33_g4731 [[Candida] boidinii]GME66869.1 unnamed protein product [[Candida] boidinii]
MSDISNLHEKIHLQLKEVKHLQNSITKNVDSKIKRKLENGSDELSASGGKKQLTKKQKKNVESEVGEILREFIMNLFEMSKNSFDIDGISETRLQKTKLEVLMTDTNLSNRKIEPFDFALNDKLRDYYFKSETEALRIARLRKQAPVETVKKFHLLLENSRSHVKESIKNQLQESEESLKEIRNIAQEEEEEYTNDTNKTDATESLKELKEKYEDDLIEISDLKKKVPIVDQKLDNLLTVLNNVLENHKKTNNNSK